MNRLLGHIQISRGGCLAIYGTVVNYFDNLINFGRNPIKLTAAIFLFLDALSCRYLTGILKQSHLIKYLFKQNYF